MFVHIVTEVWVPKAYNQSSEEVMLAAFADMGEAETYVWQMEERKDANWAVKADMGTLHYFVNTMTVIEKDSKVEDYA